LPFGYVLSALLLLQSGLGAAHCLARAASLAVEICAADGARQTIRTDEGGEAPGASHADFCAACHALPFATTPAPASPVERITWVVWQAAAPNPPPAPTPRARGPPSCPRAPPRLV